MSTSFRRYTVAKEDRERVLGEAKRELPHPLKQLLRLKRHYQQPDEESGLVIPRSEDSAPSDQGQTHNANQESSGIHCEADQTSNKKEASQDDQGYRIGNSSRKPQPPSKSITVPTPHPSKPEPSSLSTSPGKPSLQATPSTTFTSEQPTASAMRTPEASNSSETRPSAASTPTDGPTSVTKLSTEEVDSSTLASTTGQATTTAASLQRGSPCSDGSRCILCKKLFSPRLTSDGEVSDYKLLFTVIFPLEEYLFDVTPSMLPSDYTAAGSGKLKLKGVKDSKVDKKKKKKSSSKASGNETPARDRTRGEQELDDEFKDRSVMLRNLEDEDQKMAAEEAKSLQKRRADSTGGGHGDAEPIEEEGGGIVKTEAERRYEEQRRRRLEERLKREGVKTHKERVEELNRYLSSLSEHHDMPRIGPG
ncbi:hypothetical protein FOPE_00111 [Fonsecaea pedrosoi]|nr:hypothetical protein FOPE_00111 [Fonsecaea pedrosoi]